MLGIWRAALRFAPEETAALSVPPSVGKFSSPPPQGDARVLITFLTASAENFWPLDPECSQLGSPPKVKTRAELVRQCLSRVAANVVPVRPRRLIYVSYFEERA